MMKKKEEEQEIEILKAAAQAWHGRSGRPRPMKEYETQPTHEHSRIKPFSRFKLEAIKELSGSGTSRSTSTWDFSQSLWDAYEIVTLSKKLEDGMVLDHPMEGPGPVLRRRRTRESNNSLRKLFRRISSSKRYDGVKIPELDADGNDGAKIRRLDADGNDDGQGSY